MWRSFFPVKSAIRLATLLLSFEPRAGEFIQVSGKRTLNYRYWQRQEKLRVAVEQAQRRSQDTLRLSSRGQVKVSQI